jgi:Protein of unknown function (DUF3489)
MTKKTDTATPATTQSNAPAMPTKHLQVVELLSRDDGASLEEMSILANWLTHSTRAFLTGLKKKGYKVSSVKADGVRRYKIAKAA